MNKILANIFVTFIKNKDKRDKVRDILINRNPEKKPVKLVVPYQVNGKDNNIIIIENGIERPLRYGEKIEGLDIKINGNNNLIKLELPIKAIDSFIEIMNDNAIVEIGTTNHFWHTHIRIGFGDKQICKIGRFTTISGAWIILDSVCSVFIGEDCMFSNGINIRADDGHSILDKNTGEILNKPKDAVFIGNHVWVGESVRITKNARIYDNSIIGGGSVACKDYKEENVVIAGNPAKIIRREINWSRRNVYDLEKNK